MSVSKEPVMGLLQTAHGHVQEGKLQKAAEHFERAAKATESAEDSDMKISCFLNAGACLVSLGQYEEGLVYLGSASSVIATVHAQQDGEEGDLQQVLEAGADVHYNSAVAYQALNDYEQAVTEFQTCIQLYEKSNHQGNAAEVLSSLALCHREAGRPENERACLARAQSLYRELGDSSGEAVVCADMARAYLRAGKNEECKQMLSTAKMICLRVDDQKTQGRVYSQCGLIHSSLHQFDEALQSFERALPLVRASGSSGISSSTDSSHLLEASLLQNIGATYNEKGMYSESLVYHREAASMHGKLQSHSSEIKCLCNLAFAKSQLGDYSSSASSFTEALSRAQTAGDVCLQFQACEGLGASHYRMNEYSKAVDSFTSALELLDKIEEDTGIARERVMEKLSDATEALQRTEEPTSQALSTDNRASQERNQSPASQSRSERRSISRESRDHSDREVEPLQSPHSGSLGQPSPTAERGGPGSSNSLPPHPEPHDTNASRLPPLQTEDRERRQNLPDNQGPSQRKGKRKGKGKGKSKLPSTQPARSAIQTQNSCDRDIQAYEDTLISSESSDHEENTSTDHHNVSLESADQLGSSMFSRHAMDTHRTDKQQPTLTPISSQSSLSQGLSGNYPQSPVAEGSLAIGPNARDTYTLQSSTAPDQNKGKRRGKGDSVHTEIVRRESAQRQGSEREEQGHTTSTSSVQQSKMCVIL